MAYLGVVGPYAMGKTTAYGSVLDWLSVEYTKLQHYVRVVNCDINLESEWLYGNLLTKKFTGRTMWKGSATDKSSLMRTCFEDREGLWLCETAWSDHIRIAGELYGEFGCGGELIILVCTPDVYKQFLMDRCERKGKKFRADYWDDKRLLYEGRKRFLNAAIKYLNPVGFPYVVYEVDETRKVWDGILGHIYGRISRGMDEWYIGGARV